MPRPTIKVDISSVEARKGAKEVRRQLDSMIRKVRALERSLDKTAKTTTTSMVRQQRAINAAREQMLNFQQAVRLAGGDSLLIARTTRSFKALERAIGQGRVSAEKFAKAQDRFRASLGGAKRDLRAFNAAQKGFQKEAENSTEKAGRLSGVIKNIGSSTIFAVGPLSGIGARLAAFSAILSRTSVKFAVTAAGIAGFAVAVQRSVKAMLSARLEMDRILNTLKSVTGSTEGAEKAFRFVANAAEKLGFSARDSALQFAQLSAAAKSTALEGQPVKDIFLGITRASVAMGLSADQTRGALLAVQQMISKGNVQAEELRGQLGERLPGAFRLAAQAMGVTTKALDRLLKSGKVTAEDLLPKLAKLLNEEFFVPAQKASSSLSAEILKLKDSFFRLSISMDKATKTSKAAIAVLQFFRGTVDLLRKGIDVLGRTAEEELKRQLEGQNAVIEQTIKALKQQKLLNADKRVLIALEATLLSALKRRFEIEQKLGKSATAPLSAVTTQRREGFLASIEARAARRKRLSEIASVDLAARTPPGKEIQLSQSAKDLNKILEARRQAARTAPEFDNIQVPLGASFRRGEDRLGVNFLNKQLEIQSRLRNLFSQTLRNNEANLSVIKARVNSGRQAAAVQAEIVSLQQQGLDPSKKQIGLITAQVAARDELLKRLNEQIEKEREAKNAVDNFARSLTQGLKQATEGASGLKQALRGVLSTIQDIILQQFVEKPASSFLEKAFSGGGFLSSLFGFASPSAGGISAGTALRTSVPGGIGGFAQGGRPPVGQPSIVGEKGKELFIPDSPGTIISNSALKSGSNSVPVVINQQFDFRGASLEAVSLLNANAEKIKRETIAEIERRKIRGFDARR